MNHKSAKPGGLIRNDEAFQILPHPINVIRQFGTIDDDDLVAGNPVQREFPGPVLRGMRKLDLVHGPRGLVAEIHVTGGHFPLGRNVMFHLPE